MINDFITLIVAFFDVIHGAVLQTVGPIFKSYLPRIGYQFYLPVLYLGSGVLIYLFLIWYHHRPTRWRVDRSKYALKKIAVMETPQQVFGYLRKIDPFVFEEMILTAIDKHNTFVKIQRNQRYTGDGGIDGRFYINGKLVIIQAKRYSGFIKTADIEDLKNKVFNHGAAGGIFVHTGKTRVEALKKYSGEKVHIISGQAMVTLLKKGKLPLRLLSSLPPHLN
jgi:restriction system protein